MLTMLGGDGGDMPGPPAHSEPFCDRHEVSRGRGTAGRIPGRRRGEREFTGDCRAACSHFVCLGVHTPCRSRRLLVAGN